MRKAKRGLSFILALVLAVGLLPIVSTPASAAPTGPKNDPKAPYESNWLYWSQGCSQYGKMITSGCNAVAQCKLMMEAGYITDRNFTPDTYYESICKSGWWGAKQSFYPVAAIASYTNNGITCVTPAAKGSPASPKDVEKKVMDWLRRTDGDYYVIIEISHHYIYVCKAESLKRTRTEGKDTLVISSSGSKSTSSKLIDWSKYDKRSTVKAIHVYKAKPQCSYWSQNRKHDYADKIITEGGVSRYTAVCKACGAEYTCTLNSESAGTYRVLDDKVGAAYYCSAPYAGARYKKLKKGETVQILGSVENAYGNIWYRTSTNAYIHSANLKADTSLPATSTLKITTNSTITITKGKACPVKGSITSNRKITSVKATLDGKDYGGSFTPNSTSVNLATCPVDDNLIGRTLSVGTHTLVITANDGAKTVTATVNITVDPVATTATCAAPTITYKDIDGGKRVTITQNTAGATLTYCYYGTNWSNRSTANTSVTFDIDRSATVTAYSTRSGMSMSAQARKDINVGELNEPDITCSYTPAGATVTISGGANEEIYYALNGGAYQRCNGAVSVTSSCTVQAYAKRLGYMNSAVSSARVDIIAPNKPVVSPLNTQPVVPQGNSVSVSWGKDDRAGSYMARLYKDGQVVDTMETVGCSASFALSQAGTYSVTVQAVNAVGSSAESAAVSFEAKAPVTVTFVDYDDSVVAVQQVKYGGDAVRPKAPTRRGYTFDGWDRGYTSVSSDITVRAEYTINTYTVKFYDTDAVTLLATQSIQFGSAADEAGPAADVDLPEGYIFAGWRIEEADNLSNMDLSAVDSDMTAVAVSRWENQNLPIVITDAAAEWSSEGTGYTVDVTLNVADADVLKSKTKVVKILAAAKSSEDKLLGVEVQTLNVDSSEIGGSHRMFVACNDSAMADHVEVNILGAEDNGRTGTVLAAAQSVKPTASASGSYWSEWSTTKPDVAENLIQTKTQYRYRDNSKSYTSETTSSATAPAKSGWTADGYTTSWGSTVDNGYTYVASSGTRKVWTNSDLIANGYTQYQYHSYRSKQSKTYWHFCLAKGKSLHPGTWSKISTPWLNSPLSYDKVSGSHTSGNCGNSSCAFPKGGTAYRYKYGSDYYYWYTTRWIDPVYRTHYYYQDMRYTHNYYKWVNGNWSNWGDTAYTAVAGSRDVETRAMYRYMTNDAAENTQGTARTLSGSLDAQLGDLAGKKATIMVYKERNTDPTQAQMEYVGQVTLGEGNSYSIHYKTLEEPTEQTGDFVVAVALEGTSNLLNVDVIEAPAPRYAITFIDADGSVLEEQSVEQGGSAAVPTPLQKEGYRFVRWSDNATNIQRNMEIVAEYEAETYAVAFVDWLNQTVELSTYRYGDKLAMPAEPAYQGHTFLGWELLGDGETAAVTDQTAVTGNTVIAAKYAPGVFTVTFYDAQGAQLEAQQVAYGQSATLPECPAPEGMQFLGWDTGVNWWNVSEDVAVYPLMSYEETAAPPVSETGTEIFAPEAAVELTAETGATIYYTTDGSDPVLEGTEYTGPIELTESTTVQAVAVAPNKNDSEVIEVCFEYAEEPYYDGGLSDMEEIGTYHVVAEANKDVVLQVKLDHNTGLAGYLFTVECDKTAFYVDYDEETGFVCNAGNVSAGGTMFCAPYEETGWQIMWFDPVDVTETGTLFELTLHTAEEVEPGIYPIKVSYSPANTFTADGLDADLTYAKIGFVGDSDLLKGDVNGDGRITNADVVLIARHIIGLEKIAAEREFLADVNNDGATSLADAIYLARYILGLEHSLL